MDDLVEQVRRGERRAVARAISRIERDDTSAREIVKALYPQTGAAHVIGVTGASGSGKSTLVNELAKELRKRDLRIGIVAVDPSSPFTGGALLGDRIRMQDLSGDAGIFIRSMASRGTLGGLARGTASAVKVLDAAGYDVILVETVGAGQAEVDIARMAHTTVVVEAPGMGDDIQSIKAGILEVADLLVVNKTDRPGAANTVKALRLMLQMGRRRRGHSDQREKVRQDEAGPGASDKDGRHRPGWEVNVYETVATDGTGVPAVADAIESHRRYLRESGQWLEREKSRSRQEIRQLLQAHLLERLEMQVPAAEWDRLVASVAAREVDPYSAVSNLFAEIAPGV